MLRYYLSITIKFIASINVYLTPLTDTSQNKIIDRRVSEGAVIARCPIKINRSCQIISAGLSEIRILRADSLAERLLDSAASTKRI